MPDLAPGTSWGSFQIERLVGRGPLGAVYRATSLPGGKPVALKIFDDTLDEATLVRFEDDTRRLIGLGHPHILRVESVGREGRRRFVVTEAFEPRSLRDLGPRPLREACEIFLKAARALGAAWMRLILHRNLKPENILVSSQGEVKLTDFGLFQGPTPYWSPERKAGQSADMRSDLFALGTLFREFLSERHPEIDALIHHMTRVESFERTQMVEDVVSRLESFLSRTTAPTVIAPPLPPPPPPPVRSPEFQVPAAPTLPSFPPLPSWEPPSESPELKEARTSMVRALAAVTQRLQRSLAHRTEEKYRPPPPVELPRTVPPPPVRILLLPPTPPPPPPPPPVVFNPPRAKRPSTAAPILGTIMTLMVVAGLVVFRIQAKVQREKSATHQIQDAVREREAQRQAEAKEILEQHKRREEAAKNKSPNEHLKKGQEEWSRTKAAIRKLEEEMKYAQAADECDRFVAQHGAQAPPESRTMKTSLRNWATLVQQAERERKIQQGRQALLLLDRGGPERARDKERLLARWCEEDWPVAVREVEKALARSDPHGARDELDRFLKQPHQGGAHLKEAQARKLGLQAEMEFGDAVDKTESLSRSHKNAEAIAAWEAFLAQPHQGGGRRPEVEKRLAQIRETVRQTLFAGRSSISRLAVSPDGKQVAIVSDRVRVLDLASREELWSQPSRSLMRTLSFGGDALLAAFSYKVTLFDVAKKAEIRSLTITDGYVTGMAVSQDGKRIVVCRSDGALLTWEGVAEAPSRVDKDAATGLLAIALSPDGARVALGLRDKTIRIRELSTGQERKWTAPAAGVSAMAWSPDGKRLASSGTGEVTVWDPEKGEAFRIHKGHAGPTTCVTFTADGSKVASGGVDKSIRVWSLQDGSSAGAYAGHQERVTALVALPGGGLLSAGGDGIVRIWSLSE